MSAAVPCGWSTYEFEINLFSEFKEKELKILEWLNKDHDQVEAARVYEELCKIPIMPILPSGIKNETDDKGADLTES